LTVILAALIAEHGYWVTVTVALESMRIPAPGDTALVTAAIFAATTRRLQHRVGYRGATAGAIIGTTAR
jgi:membrane protein DedA with SNARE-associated domain